jgi:hypothetical protein
MAAFGGDPDIEPTAPNDQVWTHCDHGLDSNLTAQQRSCRPFLACYHWFVSTASGAGAAPRETEFVLS